MSIKTFHIVFLVVSSLFMIYMGYWSYSYWAYYQDSYYLGYLTFSLAALVVLGLYGNRFVKKYGSLS